MVDRQGQVSVIIHLFMEYPTRIWRNMKSEVFRHSCVSL